MTDDWLLIIDCWLHTDYLITDYWLLILIDDWCMIDYWWLIIDYWLLITDESQAVGLGAGFQPASINNQ